MCAYQKLPSHSGVQLLFRAMCLIQAMLESLRRDYLICKALYWELRVVGPGCLPLDIYLSLQTLVSRDQATDLSHQPPNY